MAKGPRRDRAEEQSWRKRLADFRLSGLSIRGFCRARGLHESALSLGREGVASPSSYIASRRRQSSIPLARTLRRRSESP